MVSNNGISNKTIPMPSPSSSSSSSSPSPSKGITPKVESCNEAKAKAKLKRNKYDICVIGCGLSGSVIAERYASELNKSVLVIEKRDHIGGNCYDYIDPTTNIRVNKYGAHLFHTKSKRVYEYIQLFSDWTKYEHEVLGYVDDKYVPIPVNINTVNTLFNTDINTQHQMIDWLDKEKLNYSTSVSSEAEASNSEEMAISRVGYRLYKKIFYPYTLKQWSEHPQNLGPEVTGRIPIRTDKKHKYFDDTYQCLPTNGYTSFFQNMLSHDNIELHLNIDYFDIQHHLQHIITDKIYFTGPIDHYYSHLGLPKLQYRSLNFQHKIIYNVANYHTNNDTTDTTDNTHQHQHNSNHQQYSKHYYQPNSVVNYPSLQYNYTRIVEYKHFLKQTHSPHTILFYEYPVDCNTTITNNDNNNNNNIDDSNANNNKNNTAEPFYPIPNEQNYKLYETYKQYANADKDNTNVKFVGRLANYKYFNMDEAILNALELFDKDAKNCNLE